MSEIQKHDHLLIETPPEVIGFAATRSFGAGFRVLPGNRENHAELLERQWRAIWAKHDEEDSKNISYCCCTRKRRTLCTF